MTFSDFAKILYPFCGGGSKTPDFVISLFDNIMEEPSNDDDIEKAENDEYNPFRTLGISTLEKIFSGSRTLSKTKVRDVLSHLDKEKFEVYINELTLDSISLLKESLQSSGHNITDNQTPATCADIFVSILNDCVKPTSLVNSNETLIPSYLALQNTIPESDLYLLMETNNVCPVCSKTLVTDKNNNSLSRYAIAEIIPSSPSEEQRLELDDLIDNARDLDGNNNKIALCLECANKYTSNTTYDECLDLMEIKEKLFHNYIASETLDKMYLEEEIETILRQIATASPEQLSETLSLNAVRVRDKIPNSNMPLIFKTQGYVVHYYKFIKSVFSQLEREGKLSFEDVAHDVHRSFKKLDAEGLSQDEIYNNLVDWFKNKTKSQSVLACEIIVAFFVQDCEVFYAFAQ